MKNDTFMVNKVNAVLALVAGAGKNIMGMPPVMGSEYFQHLVLLNKKQVYDYFLVGIADPLEFMQATKAGKVFPYYNHNGDFKVDLRAIPFCTSLGAVALLEMFNPK